MVNQFSIRYQLLRANLETRKTAIRSKKTCSLSQWNDRKSACAPTQSGTRRSVRKIRKRTVAGLAHGEKNQSPESRSVCRKASEGKETQKGPVVFVRLISPGILGSNLKAVWAGRSEV